MNLMLQLRRFNPPFDENLNGQCLRGCRRAFGASGFGSEDTANAAWARAKFKHSAPFPDGVDVPVHFSMPGVPDGHVVVRTGDGRIYSTGFNATWRIFADYAAFLRSAPKSWGPVKLLGWSEDINGVRVVEPATTPAGDGGTTPIGDDDMSYLQWSQKDKEALIGDIWLGGVRGLPNHEGLPVNAIDILNGIEKRSIAIQNGEIEYPNADYLAFPAIADVVRAQADPTQLAAALAPLLSTALNGDVLDAIKALDTQADNYQAQLTAVLSKGLTGTVTLTPSA